ARRLDRPLLTLGFFASRLAAEAAALRPAKAAAFGFVEARFRPALTKAPFGPGRKLAQRLVAAAFAALAGLDQPAFADRPAIAIAREFRPIALLMARFGAAHRLVGKGLCDL